MFTGWKITNILDVGLCELDTADGPYNKTGYRLEHREDGFAITVGLMEYISGWSALEILYWLSEKQAIPTRVSGAVFRVRLTRWLCDFWRLHHETLSKHVDR